MNNISDFFSRIGNKRVAFVGIGVSHIQTIKYFAQKGISVTACDKRSENDFSPELLREFKELGVELVLGEYNILDLGADILFRTPGMYFGLPELTEYRRRGGVLTSEMEVFFDHCPCRTIAVTGSDGKTTTTTLISEMLKAEGYTVHLGGNIGRALLPIIEDISPDDYAVVELSSFQLISMRPSPDISVVTNVTPNHLDVHGTMEEYISAKHNICSHQNAFSKTVLGADNETSLSFSNLVRGELLTFSLENTVYNGAYLKSDGFLTAVDHGKETRLFSKDDIRIPGIHNVANYLTAISAIKHIVKKETIHQVANSFGGVEHRIEFVREVNGVKWYNDSIATSPTRAIAGLRAFNQKLILIAGGYDKKISYDPLAPELVNHVKILILMGDTADKIENSLLNHPSYKKGEPAVIYATSMEDAVQKANQYALAGDVVTLSPASASFDLYKNFEQRGEHFKKLVNLL